MVYLSKALFLVPAGSVCILLSAGLCWWRDTGYAGPHHDEVIALQASKALEREYGGMLASGEAPFGRVVAARDWHRFTKGFSPVPWSEIRQDVQAGDKHPPLAFWVFNRWLSLFHYGGYRDAVWLTWLEIVLAAAVLVLAVHRVGGGPQPRLWPPAAQRSAGGGGTLIPAQVQSTGPHGGRSCVTAAALAQQRSPTPVCRTADGGRNGACPMAVAGPVPGVADPGAVSGNAPSTGSGAGDPPDLPGVAPGRWTGDVGFGAPDLRGHASGSAPPTYVYAFALFLAGNAAVFTATWVRQYALFAVFYALTMLMAAELARDRVSVRRCVGASVALGLVCVGGMGTQYTFATMSAPIHLALLGLLAWRRQWWRVSSLCAAYTGGAVLFLLLNPGAIAHARRVSQGIERRLQFGEALWGIPQMVIPWPSFLPAWICWLAGAAVLGAILALGAYVGWAMATRGGRMCPRITPARSACADDVSPGAAGGRMDTKGSLATEHTERTEGSGETEDGTPVDGASVADGGAPALRFQRSALSASSGLPTSAFSFHPSALPPSAGCGLRTPGCVLLTEHRTLNTDHCATSAAAVLAGMLGAGLLQFLLVGFGFYLGWATGPNHLCAFWLLTVLAWGLLLHLHPQRWLRVLTVLGLLGMVGMQVLYGWHCHRIKPRTNVQYIGSQQPDLVYLDNLTRGMVLQVTDVMPPHQRVLAAPPERLSALLATGELARYAKVLYLPMDTSVTESKPQVLDLFRQAGWTAEELPVVHPGLYEAVVLTR